MPRSIHTITHPLIPPPRHTHTHTQLGRPILYQKYGTDFCAKKLEEQAGLNGQVRPLASDLCVANVLLMCS